MRSIAIWSSLLLVISASVPPMVSAAPGNLLTLNSATGDYIGQGVSRTFTDSNATIRVVSFDGTYLHVGVTNATEWWYVDIAAPAGQPLTVGAYTGAGRAAFRSAEQAGLDIFGDGRGCNIVYASFTVSQALYGPSNEVYAFDATFEQHCERPDAPALTGELRIDNPPPPPPLGLNLIIDPTGVVSQNGASATVTGAVTCNKAVTTNIQGSVVESAPKGTVSGDFRLVISCTRGAGVRWITAVVPKNKKTFAQGTAAVSAMATATDPNTGSPVSSSTTRSIRLDKAH